MLLRGLSRTWIRLASTDNRSKFLQEYRIRSSLERLIHHYADQNQPRLNILSILDQSKQLDEKFILGSARTTVEELLIFNSRRLRQFRNLPYLVMLNPSISESYDMYLRSMSVLLQASLNPPTNATENEEFRDKVLKQFIDIHADSLPALSKGFQEVFHLMTMQQIKHFLDAYLRERISMRLLAYQHMLLTDSLSNGTFEKGSPYNGVIKPLDLRELIKRNAELVNDIFLMKYDQTVPITIDTNLYPPSFWNLRENPDLTGAPKENQPIIFPYIEYHLDYVLTEIFKNSFRSHIENHVSDPIQITVSTSDLPSYMEMRIRDKGKGIPPKVMNHVFDYSFTTYESGEGDSYKTLNVPPGEAGNTVAGMGYGLPLLKSYIEIFNNYLDGQEDLKGLLSIQTYFGWGTDVYLKTVGS